ncbi:hypothetical protein [Alicyclobacillus acidoterrestris]|uniref:Uncharacterized protein n=1 Tax=Alicyclobacillus acidoterrestris (strain ATCC 49025 / DSM 3922 / CIP 106132 / NCIMB 13137 / GD3B) TaxID=1356854 RepID=T0DDE5_ALIAG|nr:hypothetical protein [Alicyclobacillus acidoterrestris]EPZ47681.1 hypothetical protein N007_05350 [Alicyclobacillus acidoterrestris ATCC 49025]UNO48000.1 hypothetical protein K1I37_15100 [Alicyclobacillus acidoterrestris]
MKINKETLAQYIQAGGNITELAQDMTNKIAPLMAEKFPMLDAMTIGQMAKEYVKTLFIEITYNGLTLER